MGGNEPACEALTPGDSARNSSPRAVGKPDIDEGWAWMALIASFGIMVLLGTAMPLLGFLYIRHLEMFGRDEALTACIGSLLSSLMCICGPLAGWICTRLGRRNCVIVGGLLVSASLSIASQTLHFWLVFVTNGVLAGVGYGLVTAPSFINIGCYFVRRRPLASGIFVSGFPIGIFLGAPSLQYLEVVFGWRGAVLVFAGFQLNLCVSGVIMRPSSLEHKRSLTELPADATDDKTSTIDEFSSEAANENVRHPSVYKNVSFYLLVSAIMCSSCSVNITYVHLQRYVYLRGSTDSDVRMLYLAFGICGVASKLLTGLATGAVKNGQSLEKTSILIGAYHCSALTMFMFPLLANTQAFRIVCVCLISFYYNIEPAMFVPFAMDLVDFSNLNAAIGLINFGVGSGFLIGAPVAAYVTELTGNYDNAFYIAGSVNLLAAVLLMLMVVVRQTLAVRSRNSGELGSEKRV